LLVYKQVKPLVCCRELHVFGPDVGRSLIPGRRGRDTSQKATRETRPRTRTATRRACFCCAQQGRDALNNAKCASRCAALAEDRTVRTALAKHGFRFARSLGAETEDVTSKETLVPTAREKGRADARVTHIRNSFGSSPGVKCNSFRGCCGYRYTVPGPHSPLFPVVNANEATKDVLKRLMRNFLYQRN
jgi:hypothetical protein